MRNLSQNAKLDSDKITLYTWLWFSTVLETIASTSGLFSPHGGDVRLRLHCPSGFICIPASKLGNRSGNDMIKQIAPLYLIIV